MNWILGLFFLLIIIYLATIQSKKKKRKKLKEYLIQNWKKPKKNEYYNFDTVEQYYRNTKHKKEAYHLISNQTKDDLDINALFVFIDRTSSKIGQQYLYYKLRTVETIEKLNHFGKLTTLFKKNDELRLKSQIELSKLNTQSSYDLERLIHESTIEDSSYRKYLIPLSLTALISILLGFLNPVFFLVLIPVFSINLVFHFKNKNNINYYISGVSQLNTALKVSKQLASFPEIKTHFSDFSFINKINKIALKIKFISFERHLTNEFAAIIWYFLELFKILFNLEAIVFYSFIDDVIKKNKAIDNLFRFIGEIDASIATASVILGNNQTCKPSFNTTNRVSVKEISHPLIENCIVNDVELIENSMLLTGSNMSGKTTFIRTLAINSILSETLNFAFAKEFSIPFYKVYSSIRISDDLLEGKSYYLQEVLTIKKLLIASEKKDPCLFVLDEIFKGTNTIERISAGKAILSYLNKKNHFVLVSTHDIELTDLLKNENYELFHFTENVENNKLHFDHKLKKGKLKTRNALKILELYEYPDEIIKDARHTEKEYFD